MALAALPPGFEDRMFCPPGYCLGRRHPRQGMVGPKRIFWECRIGSGSEEEARVHNNMKEKSGMNPAVVEIETWGTSIQNAEEKLQSLQGRGYTERICETLHAKPEEGGVHTVYVPDDADTLNTESGEVRRLGYKEDGNGEESRSILLGSIAIICFILFCCASSVLNATREHQERRLHVDDRRTK